LKNLTPIIEKLTKNTKTIQKIFTVLISGAGSIGSRYLQGMFNCKTPLKIYVHDISMKSLQSAKKNWDQLLGSSKNFQHSVFFINDLQKVPKHICIAIISTSADVRAKVMAQIVKKSCVNFWILEKFLAQTERELDHILSITMNSDGAWVNIPRRLMTRQKEIRSYLPKKTPLLVKGLGNSWGLACNGIHYLDLVAWWTNETLVSIENSDLESQWYKSKREGFFDILGKITANYSGGSVLILESKLNDKTFTMQVEAKGKFWEICDHHESFTGPEGLLIHSKNDHQSSLTANVIDVLLENGNCELPEMDVSINMHRIFLSYLIKDWNHSHGTKVDRVPIT